MTDLNRIAGYKALVFDLDGTLIDSEPSHMAAWNEILESVGLPPMDWDYIQSVGGISSAQICRMRCQDAGRTDLDPVATARRKTDLYISKYLDKVPLFEPIAKILKDGKARGQKIAVATGSQQTETKRLLTRHGLIGSIDAIVTSDQVKHCKPAPDTYLEAARRLGVKPSDCLVFEDTSLGLQGIKAAGMTALQVAGGKIISDYLLP
jgi:beta-phosphoglucomutase family hydrolase